MRTRYVASAEPTFDATRRSVNPHGHKLGRSGVAGAYQLDHIVPVSVCWEYRVPEENASSAAQPPGRSLVRKSFPRERHRD